MPDTENEDRVRSDQEGLGEPVNDRNVRCWCDGERIDFRPHLDLESLPDGVRMGAGGVTFPDSLPAGTVEAIRAMQDSHGRLQERVWELEDDLL